MGLLHGTVVENLTFSGLDDTFCLPVKVKNWAGKRLDCAHCANLRIVEMYR